MAIADTISGLVAFEGRGAGTDAERRAALWLASQLRATRPQTRIETFWCRPNWALAHAWHTALAIAGGLLAIPSPKVGGALIIVALLSIAADVLTGVSIGRRLTPEHASQNVVAPAPPRARSETTDTTDTTETTETTLILTANYDAGRTGLIYRPAVRSCAAAVHNATDGLTPGWLAWLWLGCALLLLTAVLRNGGAAGPVIGVVQLIPSRRAVARVRGVAGRRNRAAWTIGCRQRERHRARRAPGQDDRRLADLAPGRGRRARGRGRRRDDRSAPPPPRQTRHASHASHASRASRAIWTSHSDPTIVVGLAPMATGQPRFWISDGPAIPMRFNARLRELAATALGEQARPHRGRGLSPAFPARAAGLPALTIGTLDRSGLVQNSHTSSDTIANVDPATVDLMFELAIALIGAIDRAAADAPARPARRPAARRPGRKRGEID